MTVVADTTPLNYLLLIGQSGLLQLLYGRIHIPSAVLTELQHEAGAVERTGVGCESA